MKSITMPSTVQLNDETKKELTQEVKETVAAEATKSENEIFTVSQMWNHHKQMRSASYMMNRWNLN